MPPACPSCLDYPACCLAAALAVAAAGGAGGSTGAAIDELTRSLVNVLTHTITTKLEGRLAGAEAQLHRSPFSSSRAKGAGDTVSALGIRASNGLAAHFAGDAALSGALLAEAQGCPTETSLLAKLSGYFKELLELPAQPDDTGLILVNSEMLQWLDPELGKQPSQSKYHLKPDWYLTWKPFVKFHSVEGRGGLPDGRLGSRELQKDGCVIAFFEGKRDCITNEDLGQLISYHDAMMGQCNGMVLCKSDFTLYRSLDTHPEMLVQSIPWTASGSKAAIKDHFSLRQEPPLLKALRILLTHFSLTLDYSRPEGAFLGAGAFGRVFAVKDGEAQRALKVTVFKDLRQRHLFENERNALAAAAARGAPVIAPASLIHGDDADFGSYGGYLLSVVGNPVEVPADLPEQRAAFTALAKLHASGSVHGDARLANLLRLPGSGALAWVDFMGSHAATVKGLKTDALTLLGCFFKELPADTLAGATAYAHGMMSIITSKSGPAAVDVAVNALVAALLPETDSA